jgi:ribosomal protein S18 acetylase RimI-like enzyme
MEPRLPLRIGLRLAEAGDLVAIEKLQHDAYARNRELLGVEPLPLLSDYADILSRNVVWLAEEHAGAGTRLAGVLILTPQDDDLLVWSVATAPYAQGRSVASQLMQLAEKIAAASGLARLTLYTGEKLTKNVEWYKRLGYAETRRETLPDRVIVHMEKALEQGSDHHD